MASVENGSVDIGITYLSERNPNVETSILYYDTYELVVSPEHPLSNLKHTTIESLKDIPMIMLSPDTLGRRFLDQIFKKLNLQPNIVMELSSSEEVKRMVEINLGAAVVSKLSIANEAKAGYSEMIKVNELDMSHPVGVVYKSGRYINSAMQQFLSDLKGMPEHQFISSE